MTPEEDFSAWQRARHSALTGPAGNLALVDFIPVHDVTQVPILDATVERSGDGILLNAGQDVTVDGSPVSGPTHVRRLGSDGTPLIRRGHITVDVFTLDGSDYELRVYDETSERLKNFAGIDYFPYAPEFVLPARFEAYPDTHHVPWTFTRTSDTGHVKNVPGEVIVEINDTVYHLIAFLDATTLVLTFADATTGPTTYAPGRFLRLDAPGPDGELTIDFNRSFIPPCGFSDFYSCPLPPAQNRIAEPINAGEKKVRWHGAEALDSSH